MRILFLLFFITSLTALRSQDYPITDRSFAYATAFTMQPKSLMLESGYFHVGALGGVKGGDLRGMSLRMRYGLPQNFEIRLTSGLQNFSFDNPNSELNFGGLAPLEISFKKTLSQESANWPSLYLLSEFVIPKIGDQTLREESLRPSIRLISEKILSPLFIVGVNVGHKWMAQGERRLTYSSSMRIGLSSRSALYFEFYGWQSTNEIASANFIDAAIEWWAFDDIIFDLAIGKGVSQYADDYFISIGASFRFDRKTKSVNNDISLRNSKDFSESRR